LLVPAEVLELDFCPTEAVVLDNRVILALEVLPAGGHSKLGWREENGVGRSRRRGGEGQ